LIITVGSIKGGVGKSLIATNLCVIRAKSDSNVLLIDADEQGTSGDWTDHRNSMGITTPWTTVRLKANAVRTEVLKLAKNYDDVIIDCGGRDTASLRAALTVSDIFLVPFQPKSFDIWTISMVSSIAQEAKQLNDRLISYAFINCAGSRGTDNEDAQKIISKSDEFKVLPVTVGLRKAFSNATADGLGIVEVKGAKKAVDEMQALHDTIFTSKRHNKNIKKMSL
jgi:chromosome partitioning protein